MVTGIVAATLSVALVGLFIGIFLGIAGEKFKVETDPREEEVLSVLPGNNCGGCGYAGCASLAKAIASGEAPVNGCPVGGAAVAGRVAEIMGLEAGEMVKTTAFVMCAGDCEKAGSNFDYYGSQSCRMQAKLPSGGAKKCSYGCLGGGDCVAACQFGAISIKNGIAVVDREKCTSCSACVAACPKKLIEIVPYDNHVRVACSSKDKGPVVMKACSVGCIGCRMCEKNCPSGAITVTDMHAHIDYSKCTQCGLCAQKCPKKSILVLGEINNSGQTGEHEEKADED